MNSYSMDLVFDIIELVAGLYIIYNGIKMKQTGRVEGNGLVGKNINLAAAPDEAGYIKSMFPVYMICGFIFAVVGGAVAVMDYRGIAGRNVQTPVTFGLLAVCVVFAVLTKRAQDKYLK
ncbi:MAG: hypothetical protein K6F39_05725 [Lachnospiraceae bacterium]|nr:hypothetical protein [Lachnospiraceae bacterium]